MFLSHNIWHGLYDLSFDNDIHFEAKIYKIGPYPYPSYSPQIRLFEVKIHIKRHKDQWNDVLINRN